MESVSVESSLAGAWDSQNPLMENNNSSNTIKYAEMEYGLVSIATWIHPRIAVSLKAEPWLWLTLSALPVPQLHV